MDALQASFSIVAHIALVLRLFMRDMLCRIVCVERNFRRYSFIIAVVRTPLGGDTLVQQSKHMFAEKQIDVVPAYKVRSKVRFDGSNCEMFGFCAKILAPFLVGQMFI